MSEVFYDLGRGDHGMNYRWIQPPQVAYFITTLDKYGNPNTTPVTLGTCVSVDMESGDSGNFYFVFALGCSDLPHVPPRQSLQNLAEVPECVVSYIRGPLFRETQIACLPLPRGISEIDVMDLTELPSRKVRPPGIKECKVNIEIEVVSATDIGRHYRLYVGKAVGVSVDRECVERDQASELHAGVFALDPWFEVTVLGGEDRPPRIHLAQLDPATVRPLPGEFGPSRAFVGSFENWLEDEEKRGALTPEERLRLLELNREWQAHPDPSANGALKRELTRMLKALLPG